VIELLFQNFVLIWLSIGSMILLLTYFGQTTKKKIFFFLCTILIVFSISYSIYRENMLSFRPIEGFPTEKVRYIAHNISLENKKKVIGLWAYNVFKKRNVLHIFDYDADTEKTLREAAKRQKNGSSTILSMIESPNSSDGVQSGAKMLGQIETVKGLTKN